RVGAATYRVRWAFRAFSRFQSAPRPRGRGDVEATNSSLAASKFQSAPRPRGRGDERARHHRQEHWRVSIRAAPAWARRLVYLNRDSIEYLRFQSAPRPRGRGDMA